MDGKTVKAGVMKVLQGIRRKQGFPNEALSRSTVALKLEKFDSQMGLVATIKIARELGITIPDKTNIFVSKDGRQCLTVQQSVDRILESVQAA